MKLVYSLISFSLIFLLTITNLKAQDSPSKVTILKSDKITFTDGGKIILIEGEAAISTGDLKIEQAGKVVYDKVQNKLTVYGPCIVTFRGKVERSSRKEGQPEILEHTVGDETIYIK